MTDSTSGTASPPPEEVVFKITAGALARALMMLRRLLGWLTLAYVIGLLIGMILFILIESGSI